MFHISRQIYRDLAPEIADPAQHERVLRACERVVERLVSDHRYFARPSRTLFSEIRWCFPLTAQRHVYEVIDGHLKETRDALRTDNDVAYELSGVRPRCRASTRRGTGCGHEPDPRTGYCAWHRHLADDEDFALTA